MSMPVDAPGEYASGLLARLGERDPLEVLAATPAAVRAMTRGVSDAELRRPEGEGKWSMLEVIHHLADGELVIGVRLRMIVAEERPPIVAYDQELWATNLAYRDAELEPLLAQFETVRDANLRLARRLTPEQQRRVGIHTERGAESAGYLLRLLAGHDLAHLGQLERIRLTSRTP
ncbi:MAG TPA: DinB family protein [Thermoanaerobaculia bacterium]|jgi:hypothetical protein